MHHHKTILLIFWAQFDHHAKHHVYTFASQDLDDALRRIQEMADREKEAQAESAAMFEQAKRRLKRLQSRGHKVHEVVLACF